MGRDCKLPPFCDLPHKISIHSPRMGRDGAPERCALHHLISIHSPRMGRDRCCCSVRPSQSSNFNPLSPHGERLNATITKLTNANISIHSPRMGRDLYCSTHKSGDPDFNPLSPHGERHFLLCFIVLSRTFQSTLPAWGETQNTQIIYKLFSFQSTLPAWGETSRHVLCQRLAIISIHSPCMGRDTMPDSPKE